MAGMGVGEAALLSAAIGGGTSAIQGNDPIKGAILGGLGGAALGGLGGALGGAGGTAATAAGTEALGASIASAAPAAAGTQAGIGAALSGATPSAGIAGSVQPALAAGQTYSAMGSAIPAGSSFNTMVGASGLSGIQPMGKAAATGLTAPAPSLLSSPTEWWKSLTPTQKLMYGGGAGLGLMALSNRRSGVADQEEYDGPLSRYRFNPDLYRPAMPMAGGGITELMNKGGTSDLGSYSDGGRMLKGPGDGMSDNIPATIAGKRPARLADGEFVVPADVVSHLGNGSTDAGAKQLYAMMDRVRSKRTGNKKQGRQINPEKFMPA